MKKLISLATVLTLIAALTAPVFAAEDAYALFRAYSKGLDRATSMGVKGTVTTLAVDWDTEEISEVSIDSQQVFHADGSVDLKLERTEYDEEALYYGKDGYLYTINEKGKKTKSKTDYVALLASLTNLYMEFSREEMEQAEVETLAGGNTVIRLTSTSPAAMELLGNAADAMYMDTNKDCDFSDGVQFTITVGRDGNLKKLSTTFTGTVQSGGGVTTKTYTSDMTVYSLGRIHAIRFPDDLNLYK